MTMTEVERIPAWGRQASIPACSGLPTLGVGVQPRKNPYSPGAGLHPAALVGRCGELHDWNLALRRVEIARPAQSVVLNGLRGMGKTVLLGEFYRRAEDRHWMTVIIEANTGTPLRDTLARALYPVVREFVRPKASEKLKKALATFKAFSAKVDIAGAWSFGCDLVPEEGRGSSGELEADLSQLIRDLAEAAHEQGRGLAILIDEAHDLTRDEMKALCAICHRGGQLGWPFLVALAGLPSLPRLLSKAKSSAEELFSYRETTLLESGEARQALVRAAARCVVGRRRSQLCGDKDQGPPLPTAGVRPGHLGRCQGCRFDLRRRPGWGCVRAGSSGCRVLPIPLGTGHTCATGLPAGDGPRRRRSKPVG
jgi:hypothetical protein